MNYEGSANQGNIIYTMRRDGDADHDAPTWHHSSDKGGGGDKGVGCYHTLKLLGVSAPYSLLKHD